MLLRRKLANQFLQSYSMMLRNVAGQVLDGGEYAPVRDRFFENQKLLKNPPTNDPALTSALRTAVFGQFIVCRHMSRWTEMIGPNNCLYRVKGITTEPKEIFDAWTFVRTAVMKFGGQWIYDGLVLKASTYVTPENRRQLLKHIRNAFYVTSL